jgi:methyl-CpG-binding domain protein 4
MSPYELLQEIYFDDPWKSQVSCILLNCTRRAQVDKIRDELFSKYSTPDLMAAADPAELAERLRPLGFYNRRARSLIRFSTEWIGKSWQHPRELYGIGQYAADSWDIFYNDRLDINPNDGVLVKYVIWKRSNLGLSMPISAS